MLREFARVTAFVIGEERFVHHGESVEIAAGAGGGRVRHVARRGGDSGGVKTAAHQQAHAIGAHAVCDGGAEDVVEMVCVLAGILVADVAVSGSGPVTLLANSGGIDRESVRWRKTADFAEGGGCDVAVEAEEKEVGDGGVVEVGRNVRMQAQAIEHVAENKLRTDFGIVEGLHAKVVARAEKSFAHLIPHGEGEVALKMIDAVASPGG